ncbi:TIGR02677 family protein [Rhodococcus sp. IEGM 1379]|uniref:TIGR02677 family protein n=1 Tax=Rhodococcus sp. IEGM 1379 TaxID=3047086 RepID=UPI0024B80F01|nr:TIGR02677 family protein [Rhodococcus sp. IEGM 1379]MDI9919120.1 TIGR02677 family protein [Rhodococcus sp. IEGM 1379]
MKLFSFTVAEKRAEYLWVLRAFDHARANYTVLLHSGTVAQILEKIGGVDPAAQLSSAEVAPLLDQLHVWEILERSYDGTRAASLAEYRNRHFVYQFGQAGYQVYRSVEDVLAARLDNSSLSRLALADLLADMSELAEANRTSDGDLIFRKLKRLDSTLSDMADRAAHFYLTLGDLVRTTEVTPQAFLSHKDALLTHMREFSSDLARYAPKLKEAIEHVESTGVDRMIRLAAASDERVFVPMAEREDDWMARWRGLTAWFVSAESGISESGISESERLREGTMSAIAAVLALLRRVTETRRGGVSRESQLRHLAGWFAATPSEDAAHALFQAVFDLGRPRHLSMVHPDADIISHNRSWWDAPPVEIARTLAETGRPPSPGLPGKVARNDGSIRRLREEQLAAQRTRSAAAQSLASGGVYERELNEQETEVLLSLLNAALTARVPVVGRVKSSTGSENGVQLTLSPADGSTTIKTARGRMHLDGIEVSVR